MKTVFFDTNILLDVFLAREPFCQSAQILWSLVHKKELKVGISAISVVNCFFIINKLAGSEKAYTAIDALHDFFSVVELDAKLLRKAREIDFHDYEDAIQYFSAKKFRAAAIISRDSVGFKKSDIPVMGADQFLALRLKFKS